MKNIFTILLFFIEITLNGYSQNLVPNGSFEEKTDCPLTCCRLDLVKNWFSPLPTNINSPDYFNTCSTFNRDFENLSFKSGEGCIGIGPYSSFNDYKEFLGIKLKHPFEIGKKYTMRFWVKLANACNYATSDISAYLSCDSIFYQELESLFNLIPQITNNNGCITDTLMWTKIEMTIIADKPYAFVTMGSFKKNTITPVVITNYSSFPQSFYFIEDVSIFESNLNPHQADAGPNQTSCLGDSIQLGTREEPDYMYHWEGSDGTRYTGGKPWVKPLKTTTYTLYQKDFKYDESISSVTITVDDCIDLEVPNVITPNGDGKNDVLSIANPLEHPYRLIIYNRWGQQVFDGDNTQVWEGVYKSQALAEGIYFYSLRVWSTLGALKEKSGIIHLFHAE